MPTSAYVLKLVIIIAGVIIIATIRSKTPLSIHIGYSSDVSSKPIALTFPPDVHYCSSKGLVFLLESLYVEKKLAIFQQRIRLWDS